MAYLEQILNIPYALVWLPTLVFAIVGGGLYWLVRPGDVAAGVPDEKDAAGVQTAVAEKSKDQRVAFRRQGNPVEVHVATPEKKTNPTTGSVLDRSVGGMRLALYEQVEAGTVLSVRPMHVDNIVPWVELEVRSCRPSKEMPDRFEIGCQYVKSPPYSIQLLFG